RSRQPPHPPRPGSHRGPRGRDRTGTSRAPPPKRPPRRRRRQRPPLPPPERRGSAAGGLAAPPPRRRRRQPLSPPQGARARPSRSLRVEPVADAPDGGDASGRRGIVFDLLAQTADVDGHGGCVAVRIAPHLFEQLVTAEDLPRAAGEEGEQLELTRRERRELAVHARF